MFNLFKFFIYYFLHSQTKKRQTKTNRYEKDYRIFSIAYLIICRIRATENIKFIKTCTVIHNSKDTFAEQKFRSGDIFSFKNNDPTVKATLTDSKTFDSTIKTNTSTVFKCFKQKHLQHKTKQCRNTTDNKTCNTVKQRFKYGEDKSSYRCEKRRS